jgi:purine nucleosidase
MIVSGFKKTFLLFLILFLADCSFSASGQSATGGFITPRMRVIMDNDFGGDPDGLFALTHLLLSPSVEVRAIIGSHLKPTDGFDRTKVQAENAANKAKELVAIINKQNSIPIIAGSNVAMVNENTPVKSDAVNFIIQEALRTDTKLPLYILCGAGLTEVASAYLTNPSIASHITLVWIGGPEYKDLAYPPPNVSNPEYNLAIDPAAARTVFNKSSIPIWQVPRNAYRQAIISYSQLLLKIKPQGKTGAYLADVLQSLMEKFQKFLNLGEVYILGDSPLVLLTALQSSFEADPSSSDYVIKHAPLINEKGDYEMNDKGRNIRVYTRLDIPLMFNDFFAKLELLNQQNH